VSSPEKFHPHPLPSGHLPNILIQKCTNAIKDCNQAGRRLATEQTRLERRPSFRRLRRISSAPELLRISFAFPTHSELSQCGDQCAAVFNAAFTSLGFILGDTHSDERTDQSACGDTYTKPRQSAHDRACGNEWHAETDEPDTKLTAIRERLMGGVMRSTSRNSCNTHPSVDLPRSQVLMEPVVHVCTHADGSDPINQPFATIGILEYWVRTLAVVSDPDHLRVGLS
jgi:hypothetical protein